MTRLRRPETFRARELRRAATPAEIALWQRLRSRKLSGWKFRRQQPLGPYFADFYCEEAGLVVEADGAHHFPPSPKQIVRDDCLRLCGVDVLRFENREILEDIERVLETIRLALATRAAPPPLPPGEGAGG